MQMDVKKEQRMEQHSQQNQETLQQQSLQTVCGRDAGCVLELDTNWRFGGRLLSKDKALAADYFAWAKVSLPHTWNALDGEDGDNKYDRTQYWYHREFYITPEQENKSIYLEFTGANTTTAVYVNGTLAGEPHRGGYTAFRYPITSLVKPGKNVLDVSVDNRQDEAIAPISGDFNMYGGLYRSVYLIAVDKVHVDLDQQGSSGVFLTTESMRSREIPEHLGEFEVKADIVNESDTEKSIEVVVSIIGENAPKPLLEKKVIPAHRKVSFEKKCQVEHPVLWEGVQKAHGTQNAGYQYHVLIEIRENGCVVDYVKEKFGFRYFWIENSSEKQMENGFFLNGVPYPLRGINRHSCRAGIGNAMTKEQHNLDMEIIKELGANTIRLCHYPHSDYFYDLCDDNGLVVWTEIPLVNMIGTAPDFETVTRQQLTELIYQQYNRPSIIFWGIENEIGNGTSLFEATAHPQVALAKKLLYRLDTLVKQLDTTGRYTTQAVNRDFAMNQNRPELVNTEFETNVGWKSDVIAWNVYPGWYPDENFYGTFEEVVERKSAKDSRAFALSEYGWGANPQQHELYPELEKNGLTAGGAWHPEEYQNLRSEEAVAYINQNPQIWATYCWVLFDFAVDARNEGGQTALNDKGLVTADRRTKKDSFYLYKANWNRRESFVYLTSRRYINRNTAKTYIKVYSNCNTVQLTLNSSSLGKMQDKGNGIFLLENLKLCHGKNTVQVEGKDSTGRVCCTDECIWYLDC